MKLKTIILNLIISVCLLFVCCIQTVDLNFKYDLDNIAFNAKSCDIVSERDLTKDNVQLESDIEYEVGTKHFFVEQYINNDELEFFLATIGENCVVWVQYEIWYDNYLSETDYELIKEHTDSVYQKMTTAIYPHSQTWGDVDNDGKINILLCDLNKGDIKGYYQKNDLLDVAGSNKLDIIYIDLSYETAQVNLKTDSGKELWATIAHEFQHMLSDIACEGSTNELWLNESLSALSSYLYSTDSHYIDTSYFQYSLSDYGTNEGFLFKRLGVNRGKEYLMTTLFGIYLYKNYGENVLNQIYKEYEKNIYGQAAVENILNEKFDDFKSLFLSFILATVCDINLDDKTSLLYSEPIVFNEKSYNSFYELKLENGLLNSSIKNLETATYTESKWSEKLFYYEKEFFSKAGDVKINSNADYIFYSVEQQPLKLQRTNEFNMHNSSDVVVLLINCENNELSYEINLYKDTYVVRTVFISIGAVILGCSVIFGVIYILKNKRDKKNEVVE